MKFLIIVVVALAVAFFAGAKMGVIEVPGLSPAQKKKDNAALYSADGEAKPEEPVASGKPAGGTPPDSSEPSQPEVTTPPASATEVAKPPVDALSGQKELAKVWRSLEPDTISAIVAKWSDADVAKQFSVMPDKQVGEIIALLPPDRAAKLCKLLQAAAQKEAEAMPVTASLGGA